jgi:serine protease inhibitor
MVEYTYLKGVFKMATNKTHCLDSLCDCKEEGTQMPVFDNSKISALQEILKDMGLMLAVVYADVAAMAETVEVIVAVVEFHAARLDALEEQTRDCGKAFRVLEQRMKQLEDSYS